tara:strand:- start:4292 stop:4912 length:621 start_codon:yes stop_codon:yes gene_type:complete
MARMEPLPVQTNEELGEKFAFFERTLGFVPNSFLVMQRRPELVKAVTTLSAAVYDPKGEVDLGFKRLIGHVASAAAGCQYCRAHTAVSASRHGIPAEKLEAVSDFHNSALFSEREKVALEFALAAASQPNAVTDELFKQLRVHWNEGEIVELLSVVGLFGFFNRWNDSLATPLEAEPEAVANAHLAASGWNAGKHGHQAWIRNTED